MDRIDRELETNATPETAWAAVAEPDGLGDWLEADVDVDMTPGGSGSFRFADGEIRRAVVEEVVPRQELTFSWWPIASPHTQAPLGPPTTVTITVEPRPGGGSIVRLREVAATRAHAAA